MIGCLIVLAVVFAPRILLLILEIWWSFMDPISTVWAVLGWFFAPYTTLWCCYVLGRGETFDGWNMALLVAAVVLDASSLGSSKTVKTKDGQ